MSAIVTDDNMKIFNKFADEVGKTIGKHQVVSKPSIGKLNHVVARRLSDLIPYPRLRFLNKRAVSWEA